MKVDNVSITETPALSEQDVTKYKSLIDFDEQDAKLLKAHSKVIKDKLDSLVEQFYKHQLTVPEIAVVITFNDRLPFLKQAMAQYIMELFAGQYGVDYVNRRLEIGRAHEGLGVETKFYLASFFQLEMVLQQTMNDVKDTALKNALHKVLQFDVQIAMDDFVEGLISKVKIAQRELENYAEIGRASCRERV